MRKEGANTVKAIHTKAKKKTNANNTNNQNQITEKEIEK